MKLKNKHAAFIFALLLHSHSHAADAKNLGSVLDHDLKAVEPVKKCWQPGDPMSMCDGLLVWDFQLRERFEWRENWIDFSDLADIRDDNALLQRVRLGLQINPADWVALYAQLQDARTFFYDAEDAVPADEQFITNDSPLDLNEAYVDFKKIADSPVGLKIGRQALKYGEERLIGCFEWDNNARRFDAVRVRYTQPNYHIDAFASFVVLHYTDQFNTPDTQDLFSGVYATTETIEGWFSDYYVLYRSKSDITLQTSFITTDDAVDGNLAPPGDYFTIGTRWKSKPGTLGPWDFDTEVAFQAGEVSNPTGFGPVVLGNPINVNRQSLLSGAAHLGGGYTFVEVDAKPRLGLEYNYAPGDGDPNDGTSYTFQNLFPTNHKFYGIMDRFSWQNIHNVAGKITAKPIPQLEICLEQHFFWLADTRDVWRFAGQGAVGGPGRYGNALNRGPSSYVGAELDLVVTWKPVKWIKVQPGYAHFFTGGYVSQTAPVAGSAQDADFAYLEVQIDL
jgi:hypothetical protein